MLSDHSLQTHLHNAPALAGIEEYCDEDFQIAQVVNSALPIAKRKGLAWPQALVIDVALGLDSLPEILTRYAMSDEQWEALSDNPAFKIDLSRARKEIAESGLGFKRKAATQAEMYLEEMDKIMYDPEASHSVKKDIFVQMARLGELEPKKDVDANNPGGMAFNIQINL